MNIVVLIGRLCADPELRYSTDGKPMCNFTLAVDRPYKNSAGEKDADFVRIVVFGKTAEACANNLGKGRLVAVEGRLQVRSYETPEGQKRQVSEVVAENVRFLDWPKEKGQGASPEVPFDGQWMDMPDEDLPF